MIKKSITIPFIVAIILFSELANAQYMPLYINKTTTNALPMMELKGKVKSVEQIAFVTKDSIGKVFKGVRKIDTNNFGIDFFIQFDMSARATVEKYNYKESSLEIFHQYDNIKNTETVEEHPSHYKSGKISNRTVYKYNKEGKVIQLDATGFYKDDSQSSSSKSIYKYNEKGNLAERTLFSPNSKPLKITYKYDSKGNMISLTNFGEAGEIWGRETFKIDANGNISEHAFCPVDTNTVEHSFTYKYDKNNNVIEKNYFKPGTTSKKYIYTYEYDKMGNWIKRTDFENDKAVLIAERKFEYY